jgi:hypothetical protein
MAVSFADQILAFLAVPANVGPFLNTIGLAGFAGASFARRYGQGGFAVDGVTLGTPSGLALEVFLANEVRLLGSRERRSENPRRDWYDLKVRRETAGWVDAMFTVGAQFALRAIPGSLPLGPGANITQSGISEPAPSQHKFGFQLPVTTDTFSLSYSLSVQLFATADPSPVLDLRHVQTMRQLLEDDPQFLASLDGTADQRPYVFVQVYPAGVLNGPPLSQSAVVQAFAAADVLAAFVSVPAL